MYFFRISVREANAGSFGQNVVERRQVYHSNELYPVNEGLRSQDEDVRRENPVIRQVKRVAENVRSSRHLATSTNLAANVDRQFILVIVSKILLFSIYPCEISQYTIF